MSQLTVHGWMYTCPYVRISMAPILVWVHARSDTYPPYHGRVASAGPLTLYCPLVRAGLVASGVLPAAFDPAMAMGGSGTAWSNCLTALVGNIVGFLILKPSFAVDPMSLLTEQQQCAKTFWQLSDWGDSHFGCFDVVHSESMVPQVGQPRIQGQARTGLFWKASPFSVDRFLGARTADGMSSIRDLVVQSQTQHNGDRPFPFSDVSISLPVAHCMLLVTGQWVSYCAPIPKCLYSRARLGWGIVKPLWEGFDLTGDVQVQPGFNMLDHASVVRIANIFRRCHQNLVVPGPNVLQVRDEVAEIVCSIDAFQQNLLSELACRAQSYYNVELLLNCIVFAGLLRNARTLNEALQFAVRIAVPSAETQNYLTDLLRTSGKPPSKTVLYKHRFMFVMGHNLFCARRSEAFLNKGPMVRYSTVDASPQFGWDWVICGHIDISSSDIRGLYYQSNRYIGRCHHRRDRVQAGASEEEVATLGDELHDMRASIAPLLVLLQGMPVAVGSGRADVRYKLHSLVHSQRIASCSWLSTVALVNSTFSITGDMGTESRLPFCKVRLVDLFGNWIKEPWQQDQGGPANADPDDAVFDFDVEPAQHGVEFDFEPEPLQNIPLPDVDNLVDGYASVDGAEVDLSSTIYIPGLLHITHNCVKDLPTCLRHWKDFETKLRHLCRLLSKKYSKQRLLETCFVQYPHRLFKTDYASFSANVYEGRWAAVAIAVGKVLLLERSLRPAWNLQAYNFGRAGKAAHAGEGSHHIDLTTVNAAITSDEFWGYCHMIDTVAETMDMVMSFGESCPCHWSGGQLRGPSRHSPKRLLADRERRVMMPRCPLAGMRAPELAAGAVRDVLRVLWQRGQADLLLAPCIIRLSWAAKERVMQDFAMARRHVGFVFEVKTSFWRQLPWCLFGCAHHDIDNTYYVTLQTYLLCV
jgi:hypothetical protein